MHLSYFQHFFNFIPFAFLFFTFHYLGSLLTYLYPDHNGTRQVFAVDLPSTKGSTVGSGVNYTVDPAEYGSLGLQLTSYLFDILLSIPDMSIIVRCNRACLFFKCSCILSQLHLYIDFTLYFNRDI